MRFTYIGGPTALVEYAGARLLTDPTFDPAGEIYESPIYTLRKTQSAAIPADRTGPLDAVLLSHDHHFDNLDRAGRRALGPASHVLTTIAGAERLGGRAIGLAPWQTHELELSGGRRILVTATPAQHGPAHADRGPVIGFALTVNDSRDAIYISGDTVWFDGVQDVATRFNVTVAVLFLGAARVRAVGDYALTFSAAEAVTAARSMPNARIVPLHFEGWEHFSQSADDVRTAFRDAGLESRLVWPPPGTPIEIASA